MKRIFFKLSALFILLTMFSVPVFAGGIIGDSGFVSSRGWGGRCGGWFGNGMNFHWGGGIMFIVGLLLVGLIFFIIYRKGVLVPKTGESPMDQLKRRYINGEITKEEYAEKRDFIKSN